MDRRYLLGAAAAVSASGGLGTLALAAAGAPARVARPSAALARAGALPASHPPHAAAGEQAGPAPRREQRRRLGQALSSGTPSG